MGPCWELSCLLCIKSAEQVPMLATVLCGVDKLGRPPYSEIDLQHLTKKLPVEGCIAMVFLPHQSMAGVTKYSGSS